MKRQATRISLGKGVGLPLDVATEAMAVFGRRGTGKTHTASVIVEQALEAGVPVVVLDPTDVWWGLRSTRSGKGSGYPVLVCGDARLEHHDLPLEEGHGAMLANLVVERRVPTILSLRHMRKGAQRRLVTEFLEQLYFRKGEAAHRTPVLIVIDEASTFVPQRVLGAAARMVGAVEDLVRRGRASGIGVMLVDQRPASVNTDVRTQAAGLVCHQVSAPHDRKALREWVEAHDAEGHGECFFGSLASLKRGEAWVWFPSLELFRRLQVRRRRTFDSSGTPALGGQKAMPAKLAEVDLEAVRAEMAEAVEAAEANDPRRLRQRVAELESELARSERMRGGDAEARVRAQVDAERKRIESHYVGLLSDMRQAVGAAQQRVADVMADLNETVGSESPTPDRYDPADHEAGRSKRPAPTPRSVVRESGANGEKLNASQRRMLSVLEQRRKLGKAVTGDRVIAALTGLKRTGGTFGTYLSRLRSAGYVEGGRSQLRITEQGREALGPVEPLPVGRELIDYYKGRHLNRAQGMMLDRVVAAWPGGVDRVDLAAAASLEPSAGTFGTYLSRMRGLGLIEGKGTGSIRASDELMEGVNAERTVTT